MKVNVTPAIPCGAIRYLMGELHVCTPNAEIAQDIRQRMGDAPQWAVKGAILCALDEMDANRQVVEHYRF